MSIARFASWLSFWSMGVDLCANSVSALSSPRPPEGNWQPSHQLFRAENVKDHSHTQPFLSSPMNRSSFFLLAGLAAVAMPSSQASARAFQPSGEEATDHSELFLSGSTFWDAGSDKSNTLQESVSGFFAGAALTGTKTVVKYPLDTATTRLQMPGSSYSFLKPFELFQDSYNGITLSLLANLPGGAVFFAVKDAVRASLRPTNCPKWLATTIAVAAAQVPYWIIRNPSEVVKVRKQAGIEGYDNVSALDAVLTTYANAKLDPNSTASDVLAEFYTGYWENIAYAYPADVIKFVVYEALSKGRKNLPPVEGAIAGSVATAAAQFITTPLDVIRNRLMARSKTSNDGLPQIEKPGYFESIVDLARNEGMPGLFAGASARVSKAFVSGAIQFATYEETKAAVTKFLTRPR